MMRIGLALALGLGLALASPASAQNLPSDLEEKLGIPPNSMNPDSGYRGRSYRPLPSDVEQKMRQRAYRKYGYDRDYGYHDYEPRPRYRKAYEYRFYYR